MSVAFISHSDCGRHDTGWGHPEHVGRLRGITRALRNDAELLMRLDHREGRHATAEELALAHDAGYIASVRAMAEGGGGRLDADTVVIEVEQTGAACHEGYQSCFFRSIEGQGEVVRVTEPQLETPEKMYGKK